MAIFQPRRDEAVQRAAANAGRLAGNSLSELRSLLDLLEKIAFAAHDPLRIVIAGKAYGFRQTEQSEASRRG